MKASIEQEDFLRFWPSVMQIDAEHLLPRIAAPTLILEPPEGPIAHQSAIVASTIADAELVRLAPGPAAPYENEHGMRLAEKFLESDAAAEKLVPSTGMTAILFADIVDSTALTERLGDAAFRAKARELDGALRGVIREHAGTAIEGKLLGDGVLAVFTSARQAIEAALACAAAGGHTGLPLHLGLHAGDVIREEGNVYGGAVNIAARISGLSAPGEVLVSETVRSLARTSAGVSFEDRGEQALKGVGEAVRVWAVAGESGNE
jgi:class 3 adenylate cyclase